VESNNENQTLPSKEKCELALEGVDSQEHSDKIAMLVDDEELELRELQGSPNALGFSDHFTTNGDHACSLGKDLLAKFPPNSVKMKQPFCMQPRDSSLKIVKKLFKDIVRERCHTLHLCLHLLHCHRNEYKTSQK
ncbi:Homeodomain-like transcriptional regulator, partial [Prunus dulcis]